MARFILDYSRPVRPDWASRRTRRANRRMWTALRKAGLLLGGLIWAMVVVGLLQVRAQRDRIQTRHDRQQLQYDSLLATKLAADRQLAQFDLWQRTTSKTAQ
jgi:hypothetical protein